MRSYLSEQTTHFIASNIPNLFLIMTTSGVMMVALAASGRMNGTNPLAIPCGMVRFAAKVSQAVPKTSATINPSKLMLKVEI